MDALDRAYRHEQMEARVHDALSGAVEALRRHRARLRQRPDGQVEQRLVSTVGHVWWPYLPGGFPSGQRAVEALQARDDTITAETG